MNIIYEYKVNDSFIFSCKICNKIYDSKYSLCNYNNKFHYTKINHYVVIIVVIMLS